MLQGRVLVEVATWTCCRGCNEGLWLRLSSGVVVGVAMWGLCLGLLSGVVVGTEIHVEVQAEKDVGYCKMYEVRLLKGNKMGLMKLYERGLLYGLPIGAVYRVTS